MIENVRSTMARMDAIRTTIAGPTATTAAVSGEPLDAAGMKQAMFGQFLQQAGPPPMWGADPYQMTNTALTPAAGPVRTGAPPGFEGHRNGQIPPQLLAPVPGTDERLWAPAAAAFGHMRADAARAGVTLPIEDAYRTYEDQVRLAGELGLYSEGGLAAQPGTSQHGWGRAVDLEVDDRSISWLRNNAWKYGFVETVPREPWHWEFHPAG